jgi:hypothetical protein
MNMSETERARIFYLSLVYEDISSLHFCSLQRPSDHVVHSEENRSKPSSLVPCHRIDCLEIGCPNRIRNQLDKKITIHSFSTLRTRPYICHCSSIQYKYNRWHRTFCNLQQARQRSETSAWSRSSLRLLAV